MQTRPLLPFLAPLTISNPIRIRAFTTSTPSHSSQSQSAPPIITSAKQQPSSRWLSLTKARLGKCIMFGLTPTQTASAASILSILGKNWRTLVAGSEGFVTPGLLRHKVVWGEMDIMGHVNNVTYVRYAESARIEWAGAFAKEVGGEEGDLWREMWTPKGEGMILRSIKTDYKFPMTYPDHISVFHKLSTLPTPDSTSFILDVAIFSERHQRPAARCVEDIVVYDYRIAKPIPIRPFMMKVFEKTWREQERVKRQSLEAIEDIEVRLRELEMGSWDREGAVEDMGTGP